MNKKNTKQALLSSVIALLLCVCMLVGTTFAWFTDSVTSGSNNIIAGNLDVELYDADGNKVDNRTDLFTDGDGEAILWEPGAVAWENLTVANEGTLALRYQLAVNFFNENWITDGNYKLSQILKVAVVDPIQDGATREEVLTAAKAKGASLNSFVLPGDLSEGESDSLGLVIYWEPSANDNNWNVNNGKTTSDGEPLHITLGINLTATQKTEEDDSFGIDYDEKAWMDAMVVLNESDLKAALANGGRVLLAGDVAVTSTVEIPKGVTVTLNLNGNSITGAVSDNAIILNNGTLTVGGDGSVENTIANAIKNTCTLTIDGGTYVTGQEYALNNTGKMTINDAVVTNIFNAGDAVIHNVELANAVDGNHGVYHSGSALVINGGTFSGTSETELIHAAASNVTINGGTFSFNPANWVSDGHTAVDNGDGTYSVIPALDGVTFTAVSGYPALYTDGTDYYVYSAKGLTSLNTFFANNRMANSTWGKTYNIMADIDATGYTWNNVYMITGSNTNNGIVLDGHGNTVTGLNITGGGLLGGTPNGSRDDVTPGYVRDLTFDNVTVTGDHFVGVVWGGGACPNDIVFDNVNVINSTVTGACNVGGIMGATGEQSGTDDANVTFKNCSVKNTVITATGKNGQDPNGVSAFLGRAYANTNVFFEGENVSEGNTLTSNNGLVGGGIYGYTTWANGGFAGTGSCDSFTDWKGVSVVTSGSDISEVLSSGASEVILPAGTYTLPSNSIQAGQTIVCEEGTVFTGTTNLNIEGATVVGGTFSNDSGYAVSGTINGTFKDCTFESSEVLRWCYTKAGEKVVFENCVFKTDFRGIHFDEMNGDVTFKNCEINGFNAYSGTGTMTFEGCTFGYDESSYNGLNIYSNTNLIGCTFNYVSGKTNFIDLEGTGKTLTVTDCVAYLDGAEVSVKDFVGGSKLAQNTVVYQ